MMWYLVIGGILAGFVFVVWYLKVRRPRQASAPVLRVYSDIIQMTPRGATLLSKNGVRPELIQAADNSLSRLFADCRRAGYTRLLDHSDYLIYVIPPDREYDSDGNYVPNFLIPANDYDGTVYDHDPRPGIGRIYAAEYVVPESLGAAKGEFVIAEYTRNFEVAEEAIRNGPEHLILFVNDPLKYEATKFHGNGGGHPLIAVGSEGIR